MAFDINPYLISMYQALQAGWIPPDYVSEEEYAEAKKGNCPDYLRGFIGFGCSFGGKWFGGYARSKSGADKRTVQGYALHTKNGLLKMLPKIKDVSFVSHSYTSLLPLNYDIIYCDPPYEGTTPYDFTPKFDHVQFWKIMREWSKTNTVLISSYSAPEDFTVVWEKQTRTDLRNKDGQHIPRVEKLFKFAL